MKVVLRQHPTYTIADIDDFDALALRRWYDNSSSDKDNEAALGVIKSAHSRDGWIACDCLSGDDQPLLAPVRQSHTYTIKRLSRANGDPLARSDRPNHAEGCPFRFDKEYGAAKADMKFFLRPVIPKNTAYFDGLPALADKIADRDASSGRVAPTRSDRPSALGIQLWRLIDGAGLNTMPPLQDRQESPKLTDQVRRIKAYAKTLKALRTWRLSSLLSTWANDCFDENSPWQRNFVRSKPYWPSTQRPTAFMTVFTTGITESKIYPASIPQPIEVTTRVRRPLRGDPKNRGPFLTIINFDDGDENEGPMRAVQAFAQPVHSGDTLYPVESGFERAVLDFLIWAQAALAKAAPFMKIAIHKPLFAVRVEDGPCRPDFILDISIPDRPTPRLIIEALGFDTDEYEAAKAVTLPRMRCIGPVFEIRPPQIIEKNAAATSKLLLNWILANTNLA